MLSASEHFIDRNAISLRKRSDLISNWKIKSIKTEHWNVLSLTIIVKRRRNKCFSFFWVINALLIFMSYRHKHSSRHSPNIIIFCHVKQDFLRPKSSMNLKELTIIQKYLFKLVVSSISKILKVSQIWKWKKMSQNHNTWLLTVSKIIDYKIWNAPWFLSVTKSLIYKKKNELK